MQTKVASVFGCRARLEVLQLPRCSLGGHSARFICILPYPLVVTLQRHEHFAFPPTDQSTFP